jgi:hypothetical protein
MVLGARMNDRSRTLFRHTLTYRTEFPGTSATAHAHRWAGRNLFPATAYGSGGIKSGTKKYEKRYDESRRAEGPWHGTLGTCFRPDGNRLRRDDPVGRDRVTAELARTRNRDDKQKSKLETRICEPLAHGPVVRSGDNVEQRTPYRTHAHARSRRLPSPGGTALVAVRRRCRLAHLLPRRRARRVVAAAANATGAPVGVIGFFGRTQSFL